MNTQSPEKRIPFSNILQVHSVFRTIQGEGPFAGVPAIFVRLAGCNLQCPSCDTDYTSNRVEHTVSELLERINSLADGVKLVVITGGEPFRQDITRFIRRLARDYFVQVETNGSLPAPYLFHKDYSKKEGAYLVCSPKTGSIHPSVRHQACAFKYVLTWDSVDADGLPLRALEHTAHPAVAKPEPGVPVYLQPCDHKDPVLNARSLQACIDSCMVHGYTLQLQIHKILELE